MCGIFGYVGLRDVPVQEATDLIQYRGPDAEGFLQHNLDTRETRSGRGNHFAEGIPRVALGFRRLAIIDLDDRSNQPFSDETGKYHIIFNGEIYNYLEIREELRARNYKFRTESDTEVLLAAYQEWGTECQSRLNGMWAFAILDIERQLLFCSRDRFGIKPFYYFTNDRGEFYFASEIKQFFSVGIPKEINSNVIRDYLDQRILDHTEQTFFKGIMQIPGGFYLSVTWANAAVVEKTRYWKLEVQPEFQSMSYVEACDHFRELFIDSIKLRFRSDVRVGASLSGGLDSSAVVAVACEEFDFPIHTYTARFDMAEFDESGFARHLLNKYPTLCPRFCSPTDTGFLEEFDKVLFHLDEPCSTMSNFARWEVMKLVKDDGVTVVLNGQGADELLAGYRKFMAFYLKEKLGKFQLIKFLREFYYLLIRGDMNFFDQYEIRRYFNRSQPNDVYTEQGRLLPTMANIGLRGAQSMNDRCLMDVEQYSYPVLLRYEDRLSMAFSLETRVPFLDYRLVQFLYSISSDFKIRHGYTKAVLRDGLEGILPKQIQRRVSKLGFNAPDSVWMKNSLNKFFLDQFENTRNPWVDGKKLASEFRKYPSQTKLTAYWFFSYFCFDRWYQTHFCD